MQKNRTPVKYDENGAVLGRVCDAYNFTTSLQLAQHLGMAASSMSARRTSENFPADIVVQCCLETGANLEWIAKGTGTKFEKDESGFLHISLFKLVDGQLFDSGHIDFDKQLFLPGTQLPANPICMQDDKDQYIIDKNFTEVYDGKWLVSIEGKVSVRSIVRIPVKKLRINGGGMSFDCALGDIDVIGRVVLAITN